MQACVISSAERIRSCVLTNAFSDIPAGVYGVKGETETEKKRARGQISFKVRGGTERGEGHMSVDSGCQHI